MREQENEKIAAYKAKFRKIRLQIILILLVLFLNFWAGLFLYLATARTHSLQAARAHVINLSRAFEENIRRVIGSVDQLLLNAREQYARSPESFDVSSCLRMASSLRDVTLQLSLIDRDGMLLLSSLQKTPSRVDLSDREHFRVHREAGRDELFISKPLLGRVSGKWSIQFSRKILDASGDMAGVLVLSVDPGYLSGYYSSIEVGNNGVVALVGLDGFVRARNRISQGIAEKPIRQERLAKGISESGRDGIYEDYSDVDGIFRIFNFRRVQDFPLVVVVGLARDDVLGSYWSQLAWALSLGAVFTCVLGWFSRLLLARFSIAVAKDLEALQESEEKFHSSFANAAIGLAVTTPDGHFLDVNNAYCRITGYSVEELRALERVRLVHPADYPEHQELIGRLLDGRIDDFVVENRYVRKDGEPRWVRRSTSIVRNLENAPRWIIVLVEDITTRKLAEAELIEAKLAAERHAASQERLARAARDLSKAVTLEMVTAVVCTAVRELTGADGASFAMRQGDECRYAAEDAMGPVFKGRPLALDACISGWVMLNRQDAVIEDIYADPRITADIYRSTFIKSLAIVPVRSDDPIAAIGSYWAARRRAEPETMRLLGSLADLTAVAMESVRLYSELQARAAELETQKNIAETATKAKSEFLANMSHEIRTPMNGVLGMTELALLENIPPRAREYLGFVRQSGRALLDIINDILDLSKIESGMVVLEHRPFMLRESVESSLSPMGVVARNKGLEFRHSVAPGLPDRLVGDQGRLRQVLTNLVDNAIKFTEKGGVRVSVDMDKELARPGKIRLLVRVEDDGIGIPRDRLEEVFQPFTQVGLSSHMKYGGTGLGLSISKELVEMMGGRIWADTEIGKGSTFCFTAECGLAGRIDELVPTPVLAEAPQQGKALRILMAEDNLVNRTLAVELLQRDGHLVETAENGREALDKLRAEPFDLVLMDVRMPGMNGEEAVRAIRRGEAGADKAHVPVVALTAHALKGDRERFLAVGMDDHLPKPIDMAEVREVLARIVARKSY